MTDDVRSHNVGDSDYAKRKIQPWSIWEEYKLNPWDADIVKRVLRNKKCNSRKMEYEKIIHVCQERIRQLNAATELKKNALSSDLISDHVTLKEEVKDVEKFLSSSLATAEAEYKEKLDALELEYLEKTSEYEEDLENSKLGLDAFKTKKAEIQANLDASVAKATNAVKATYEKKLSDANHSSELEINRLKTLNDWLYHTKI